jgi:flagellar basal-body rod modification protein FlgD
VDISSTQAKTGTAYNSQNPESNNVADQGDEYIDMFVNLLVAQISNQDPFNAKDGTEYVTQMAQLYQVQATEDMREAQLDSTAMMQALNNLSAVSLAGEKVSVQVKNINIEDDQPIEGAVLLDQAANNVRVYLYDVDGNLVKEVTLGDGPIGALDFSIDDLDSGIYSIEASFDVNGKTYITYPSISGTVEKVITTNEGVQLDVSGIGYVSLSQVHEFHKA